MAPTQRTPQQRDRRFARVRTLTRTIFVGSGALSIGMVGYLSSVTKPHTTTTTHTTVAPTTTAPSTTTSTTGTSGSATTTPAPTTTTTVAPTTTTTTCYTSPSGNTTCT